MFRIPFIVGIIAILSVVGVGLYVSDFTAYLGNNPATCNNCHVMDAAVEFVIERTGIIQRSTREAMDHAQDALVAAIAAIEKAAALEAVNADLLAEARNLHREAQLRWDFIAAENSMGFHNPTQALRILTIATDLARQAELKALQAGTAQ